MKKILISILTCLFFSSSFADNSENIQIKIKDTSNNTHLVCLPNLRCVSIDRGLANRIVMIDIGKRTEHAQTLPSSCKTDLKDNQTMIIAGRIVHAANDSYIQDLKCSVIS